jgi:hypothetical protein
LVWSKYYIYLGNSSDNIYDNRINGGLDYCDSFNFTFIRIPVRNDSNTESTTESITEINNITVSNSVANSVDNIQSSSFTTASIETSTKSNAYTFIYDIKSFIIFNIFISYIFCFLNP